MMLFWLWSLDHHIFLPLITAWIWVLLKNISKLSNALECFQTRIGSGAFSILITFYSAVFTHNAHNFFIVQNCTFVYELYDINAIAHNSFITGVVHKCAWPHSHSYIFTANMKHDWVHFRQLNIKLKWYYSCDWWLEKCYSPETLTFILQTGILEIENSFMVYSFLTL